MTSEIRANTLKNRVGLGTVSFTNTGPVVSGIVTANTLRLPDATSGSLGRVQLGNGLDLSLFHNGTNSFLVNNTGYLSIQSQDGVNGIFIARNAEVNLYFGPSVRLQTSSVGVTINKDLDVDGHTNLDNVSVAGVTTISSSGNALTIGAATNASRNLIFSADRGADAEFGSIIAKNTGGNIAAISFYAGDDGTNKDNGQIVFRTSPHSGQPLFEHMRLNESGTLLFGITEANSSVLGSYSPKIQIESTSVAGSSLLLNRDGNDGGGPYLFLGHGRGGSGLIQDGDNLGNLMFVGGTGSNFRGAANISCLVDIPSGGAASNTSMPGALVLSTSNHNQNNPVEAMRIRPDGRIVIGGSNAVAFTPHANADELVVGNTSAANRGITILGGNNNRASIYFGDTDDNDVGQIDYNHNNNAMAFHTNGSERLRIKSDGQITHTNFSGIGLHMSGGADPTIRVQDTDGTNQFGDFSHNGGDTYINTRNNSSHGEFVIYSQNGSETLTRIKISNDGTWTKYLNSSTPQAAFGGTGQINGITGLPSMAGNPLVVGRDTGSLRSATFGGHLNFTSGYGIQGTEFSVYGNTSGLYLNSNVSGDAIIFQTHNGSSVGERLRIDSNGRLLVNTTSASISSAELFEVKSTGNGFSHFRNNHSGYAPIYIDNEYTNTAMAPLITITDGGGNRAGLLLDPNSVFDITGQGAVSFSTGGTVGNAIERARITSQGNIVFKDKDSTHTGGGVYSRTKTVTNSGDSTTSFMRFQLDHGAIAGMIFLIGSNSGSSVARVYSFAASYNTTVNTNPISDSGTYSGNHLSFTSSTNNNQHNFMVQVSGSTQEVTMTVFMGNTNQNLTYTEL